MAEILKFYCFQNIYRNEKKKILQTEWVKALSTHR